MQPPKVKYLKDNNGSWSYRRRVPTRHHKTLGFKTWNVPCGDVDFAKAVIKVTTLAKQHDVLLSQLDDPETANSFHLAKEAMAILRSGFEPRAGCRRFRRSGTRRGTER